MSNIGGATSLVCGDLPSMMRAFLEASGTDRLDSNPDSVLYYLCDLGESVSPLTKRGELYFLKLI